MYMANKKKWSTRDEQLVMIKEKKDDRREGRGEEEERIELANTEMLVVEKCM